MTICVYDTETTGLVRPARTDLPGITQIAAVLYDWDGNEIDAYETKVNPEIELHDWEDAAIKITGIKPQDAALAPSFFEIFPAFADFVSRASVFSGYNICPFDDVVLYNNLVRYGFEKHFPWPRRRLDVINVVRAEHLRAGRSGNKPPKLGELYKELFDEELVGAHDALVDVRGCGRILFEIAADDIKRFRS